MFYLKIKVILLRHHNNFFCCKEGHISLFMIGLASTLRTNSQSVSTSSILGPVLELYITLPSFVTSTLLNLYMHLIFLCSWGIILQIDNLQFYVHISGRLWRKIIPKLDKCLGHIEWIHLFIYLFSCLIFLFLPWTKRSSNPSCL